MRNGERLFKVQSSTLNIEHRTASLRRAEGKIKW
jgi:hypothetical protein